MMKTCTSIIALGLILWPVVCAAALPVGTVPPRIKLAGDAGGKVAGGVWDSSTIKGKVCILFYVDPDESDTNEHVAAAIAAQKFSRAKFQSVAIINMAATWLPNFAINSKLEAKQKKYPKAMYVTDVDKLLVNKWRQADDSSNSTAFDASGKVIFSKDGKLSDADVARLIGLITEEINKSDVRIVPRTWRKDSPELARGETQE